MRIFPRRVIEALVGIVLLFAPPLAAQNAIPGRPVLQKNAFFLTSSGFRVQFANDAASKKLLASLPAHKFVVHAVGGAPRYLYADPTVCICVYYGDDDAYRSYRAMLTTHLQVDDVDPDYRSQASALLNDPIESDSLENPTSLADFFRDNL
jgi:hypothetical protein